MGLSLWEAHLMRLKREIEQQESVTVQYGEKALVVGAGTRLYFSHHGCSPHGHRFVFSLASHLRCPGW